MRKILAIVFVMLFMVSCSKELNEVIAEVTNGVVIIFSEKNGEKEDLSMTGLGTGFFIGENVIITNYHVVSEKKNITVFYKDDGIEYQAEYVFGDEMIDLAVLRLKDWDKFSKDNPEYKALTLSKELPQAGEILHVIGHPWGLFYSVSRGIASHKNRKITFANPSWYIQTDAHLFNGNSGGPVFTKDGKVVGVSTIMVVREGGSYGLIVPSLLVKKVLADFAKYKEVRWAVIGVSVENLSNVVDKVTPDSPAFKAGLREKDKIKAIKKNDKTVPIRSFIDLLIEISVTDYKSDLVMTVERDDKVFDITISPNFRTSDQFKKMDMKK